MKEGRPSSALFKDSKGVSVDRDGGREIGDIIIDEERLHSLHTNELSDEEIRERGEELKAIIQLTSSQCDSVAVCVIPDPISGENEYHALLQKSETEIQLSKSQARACLKNAFREMYFTVCGASLLPLALSKFQMSVLKPAYVLIMTYVPIFR